MGHSFFHYFAPSALYGLAKITSFLGRCFRLFHFGPLALSRALDKRSLKQLPSLINTKREHDRS
jgi:hypothetical protein